MNRSAEQVLAYSEKYGIVNGAAELLYNSLYHGDYPLGGDLWITEDGLRQVDSDWQVSENCG